MADMASHIGSAAQLAALEEAATEALDPDSVVGAASAAAAAAAAQAATASIHLPTPTSTSTPAAVVAVRDMFQLPDVLRRLRPWNTITEMSRAAPTIAVRSLTLVRRHDDYDDDDDDDLDDGALAGVVVGVVIFSLLLALCLYPVIVHCVKKRRNGGRDDRFDPEAAMAEAAKPGAHPRLSSSDSLKHGPQLSRGHTFAEKPRGGLPGDSKDEPVPIDGPDPLLLGFGRYDPATHQGTIEYMPQDIEDDQPGILKGTSEDYYRPSIPSEAFGMVTTPDPVVEPPIRSLSRAGTFSHNVKHMLSRKSRDRAMSTPSSTHASDAQSPVAAIGPTPMPTIITTQDAVAASPTELSPASSASAHHTLSRSIEPLSRSPPSPLGDRRLPKSPSPPHNPAPGTVNPMDIMPASTESEVWHRTEHQLFSSSNDSPSPLPQPLISEPEGPPSPMDTDSPSPKTTPNPTRTEAGPHPTGADAAEAQDVVAQDMQQPQKYLSSNTIPENGRHPSFPSEHSTPLPGQAFTDVSSQTTPSTQIDSPSPESLNSSDFRHSASPGNIAGASVPSPKPNGLYHCDEPGCNQTFDQPHKLKYVPAPVLLCPRSC